MLLRLGLWREQAPLDCYCERAWFLVTAARRCCFGAVPGRYCGNMVRSMYSVGPWLWGFSLIVSCNGTNGVPPRTECAANSQTHQVRVEQRHETSTSASSPIASIVRGQIFESVVALDVPFSLEPDGKQTVGYLRKGTVVDYFGSQSPGSGEWLKVITGFPSLDESGGFPLLPGQGLAGWIPKLWSPRGNHQVSSNESSSETFRFGLLRQLLVAPGGAAFSYINCGKTRVLDKNESGRYLHVSVEVAAGELLGWIENPEVDEPDIECGGRMLMGAQSRFRGLPWGYLPVQRTLDGLRDYVRKRGAIYWGTGDTNRQCRRWEFRLTTSEKGFLLHTDPAHVSLEQLPTVPFLLHEKDPYLHLYCPNGKTDNGRDLEAACVWDYVIVSHDERRVGLIPRHRPSRYGSTTNGQELVGYSPSKSLNWYFTREDCEKSTNADPKPWLSPRRRDGSY